MDLRCDSRIKFAELLDPHTLEVKCRSNRCGHGPGVVVLHQFNLLTGEVTTRRFREPIATKEARDGSAELCAAVRSA